MCVSNICECVVVVVNGVCVCGCVGVHDVSRIYVSSCHLCETSLTKLMSIGGKQTFVGGRASKQNIHHETPSFFKLKNAHHQHP